MKFTLTLTDVGLYMNTDLCISKRNNDAFLISERSGLRNHSVFGMNSVISNCNQNIDDRHCQWNTTIHSQSNDLLLSNKNFQYYLMCTKPYAPEYG